MKTKLELKQLPNQYSVLLNGKEIGDITTSLTLEMRPPQKPKVTMTLEIYVDEIELNCEDITLENDC